MPETRQSYRKREANQIEKTADKSSEDPFPEPFFERRPLSLRQECLVLVKK